MTTTIEQDAKATRQFDTLRSHCMHTAVLLIVQFALGVAVNLYVTLPAHKSFFSTVFGSGLLAAHAIVALVLLGAAIVALVRAIRASRAVALTSVGLAAILVAAGAGASFTHGHGNSDSFGMAVAAAVAMFCYLTAVFRLR